MKVMLGKLQDFTVDAMDGHPLNLADFAGRVVLLVNVASKCGLTPQYAGLETLYRRYRQDGLVVLGMPCNQFARQEPGSESEIIEFCRSNYQVSFPMTQKIEVNGENAHPIYRWLTGANSPFPGDISWNFEKFVIGRDGRIAARFPPSIAPDDRTLEDAIVNALGEIS